MNRTRLMLFMPLIVLQITNAQGPTQSAEQASVTFYSSGPTVVSGWPLGLGAFMGKIYVDGTEFGRLDRHKFVTFKLAPGPHEFALSSWMGKSPDRHARLAISLEADGQYFLSTNFTGGPGGQGGLLVREVTCDAAMGDNTSTRPLDRKELKPEGAAAAVTAGAFPQCH